MARTAHLVGPGVLRLRNNMPCWEPVDGPALLLQPETLQTLVVHGSADMTAAALHSIRTSQGRPLTERLQLINALIRSFAHYYRRCNAHGLFADLDRQIRTLWTDHTGGATPSGNSTLLPVTLTSYLQAPNTRTTKRRHRPGGYGGWRKLRAP